MGHVVRSLRVILELEARFDAQVYVMGRWTDGADAPLWRRHPLHLQPFTGPHAVPHPDISWLLDRLRAPLLVCDLLLQEAQDAAWLAGLRSRGVKVATLHEHVFPWADVDLAVNPSIFEQSVVQGLEARRCLQGPEFLLIDSLYADPPAVSRQQQTVVIALGGADPEGLRLQIVQRLQQDPRFGNWRIVLVQGPAMAPVSGLDPRVEVLEQPGSLVQLLQEATIAITNGGTTCYEAIAAGATVYATPQNNFEDEVIALLIQRRLCQLWPPMRWEDGKAPPPDRGGIDGLGVSRVAQALAELYRVR